MRIAVIANGFPLLSETFVLNQIIGLINRGHEVDIYTRSYGDYSKMHPDVLAYKLLSRTYRLLDRPRTLSKQLQQSLWLLLQYSFVDPLRLFPVLTSSQGSFWDCLSMGFIGLGKKSYDIVHCQFGTLGEIGHCFRSINGGRLVVSFRGYDISSYIQQHGKSVYDSVFANADLFLTNCEFFRQRLLQLGCDPARLHVLYSGLALSQFPFQERHFPEDGQVKIAFTGRLVEKKGIRDAITAVAQVAKRYPKIEFNIIGEGILKQELQALIDAFGLQESIHLRGQKDRQEVIQILSQSHLFIAPSITASDGNQDAPTNVLKEAMALGLPVISTRHGGIPELVQDGISGFLVPEGDPEALADRLLYLIEHSECWPEMGRAGRQVVEQVFDLEALNDQLVHLYEKALTTSQDHWDFHPVVFSRKTT
ncbi:MAG: colanic acid biosynthesis glycosyltransferase WcaL [Synechococcaceae cyanobacterium SM2_3_1]|nr:colanic acid biosynthesis glycosyltransferase WcaL [Synechococcaceae cyanobacterium SM2_3_1]